MKNNKLLSIFILVFLIISVITNFAVLNTKGFEPDYRYFTNPIIISILISSIVLDILLFIFVFIFLIDEIKYKKFKYLIYTIVSLLIFLIWAEIIYASTWYYGFGNHQGGLVEANNWGIIGSIILSLYLITYTNINSKRKFMIYCSVFVLHVFLFLMLSPINILKL